jgi:hypothetical protein
VLTVPLGVVEWVFQEVRLVVVVEGSIFDKLAFSFFSVGLLLLEGALLAVFSAAVLQQLDPSSKPATQRPLTPSPPREQAE